MSTNIVSIRQWSSNRYLDAYNSGNYAAVTKPAQNADSQKWMITPIGQVYKVVQLSSNRYLDAYEGNDYNVVTRVSQNDDTQKWVFLKLNSNPPDPTLQTIQQLSSGRFLDAYETNAKDYQLVTWAAQNDNTQKWQLSSLGNGSYSVKQWSSGRFMDAYESADKDYRVVTRTAQNYDNTQKWNLLHFGDVYTVQQVLNNRYLDAYQSGDFNPTGKMSLAVTMGLQNNDTQKWIFRKHIGVDLPDNLYTIQQMSSRRFLDASELAADDYCVQTQLPENNETQKWLVTDL